MALAVGMSVSFSACSDDDKADSNGGNGGNGGDSPEDEYVAYPKADGIYLGEDLVDGMGHYAVILHTNDVAVTDAGYLEGTGDAVWIEMMADLSDAKNVVLASGTYKPVASEEELDKFTYMIGEAPYPSFVASCADDEETDDMITEGDVTVERKDGVYVVKMKVKTESGAEKMCKYEGRIDFSLMGVPIPPDEFSGTFTGAQADYYGDFYESGLGNTQLLLTDIEEEAAPGHTLYLDLNTTLFASQAAITVVPGTYACDQSQSFTTTSTFNAGFITVDDETGDEYYNGSFWVESDSEGGEQILLATGGSMTVSRSGANYTVTVEIVLEDGSSVTGTYSGPVAISDESCLSRLDHDVAPVCTKGRAIFRGESMYYQNNSYNWVIWLAASGIDLNYLTGTGEMIQIEINTDKNSTTEIPTGEYKVIAQINHEYLVPFTYIPGFFDTLRGMILGTWYTKDLEALAPAVAGTLRIENKGGGNYAIRYEFTDDYYYSTRPNKITGTYDGKLEYSDESALEEQAPAKRGFRKAAPGSQGKASGRSARVRRPERLMLAR